MKLIKSAKTPALTQALMDKAKANAFSKGTMGVGVGGEAKYKLPAIKKK